MKYTVIVAENSHYMEESESYAYGEFEAAEVALITVQKIVDADLESFYRSDMTADELYRYYTHFGSDPYIVSADQDCLFSAWNYARERCQKICRRAAG